MMEDFNQCNAVDFAVFYVIFISFFTFLEMQSFIVERKIVAVEVTQSDIIFEFTEFEFN